MSEEIEWREPVAGFEFEPDEVVVSREHQEEKLTCCGLDSETFKGNVDASFYIGIGIRAGIRNGITAEGNVNMLSRIVQHRPVSLDEPLLVKGGITAVTPVPRGRTVDTDVWFEDADGERAISVPRRSLKPDPAKVGERGAGERPAPVVKDPGELIAMDSYTLTPEMVKGYSMEGNSIHYEMESAQRAGFRAPIIGGGMGVHYLLYAMWKAMDLDSFEMDIYFRRPIFWDHEFTVYRSKDWRALCLAKDGKVLTEARVSF